MFEQQAGHHYFKGDHPQFRATLQTRHINSLTNNRTGEVILCRAPSANQLIKYTQVGIVTPVKIKASERPMRAQSYQDAAHARVFNQRPILQLVEFFDRPIRMQQLASGKVLDCPPSKHHGQPQSSTSIMLLKSPQRVMCERQD